MNECYIELKQQWKDNSNNENRRLLLNLHNQYDESKNASKKIDIRDKVFTPKHLPKTIQSSIFAYVFHDLENLQVRCVSKDWKTMTDDFINFIVEHQIAPKIFSGLNYQKNKFPLRFIAVLYSLFENKIINNLTIEIIFKASNNAILTTPSHQPNPLTLEIWRRVLLEDIVSLVSVSGLVGLWLNPNQPNAFKTLLKNLNPNYKNLSDKIIVPKTQASHSKSLKTKSLAFDF